MTRAMPVVPDTCYLQSRRCLERRFFLKPSKASKQIYEYCLALAAQRHGIEVHAYFAHVNHDHVVFTDRRAEGPAFRQFKNSLIARAMNHHLGREEAFWSTPDRDVTELVDEGAQLDAYIYTLANPVKDGCVSYGHQWAGPRSSPSDLGRTRVFKRPAGFFSDKMPETVELTLTPLPALAHLSRPEAVAQLQLALDTREAEYREQRRQAGRPFAGRRAMRKLNPFDAPKRPPKRSHRRDGTINARIKCADRGRRVAAIAALKRFWQEYVAALLRFREGERDTVFPAGTYGLRRELAIAQPP